MRRSQRPGRPTARTVPVFANPSGRRWRWLRAVLLTLLVVAAASAVVAVPRVLAPPTLAGAAAPDGPTPEEVGDDAPVVGAGPLVRVVRLLQEGGATYAQEPFTGQVVSQLTEDDAATAGDAPYALERYGYGPGVDRTISLTFDDGPDPVWTPRLLDLLSEYGVPATFFVTGTQTARYPEIMQRIVREGHALGNHSLTHIDVSETTPFRQRLEMSLADRITRAQTGQSAAFFRLPYEGADEETTREDTTGILRAQQMGYVVASHDFDTLDWAHGSGLREGGIPMPPLGDQENLTMLLHDAGGDRSQTLAYVEELVREARDQGYTFTTMPQSQPEIAGATGTVQPALWDHVALWTAQALFVLPPDLLYVLFVLALVTMLGFGLFNAVLAVARSRRRTRPVGTSRDPVTVLIAAYNEEAVIARTLEYLLRSEHPVGEIVVVDDGSTDHTAAAVRSVADRDPRIRLLRQANTGKWAALNRGFAAAQHEIVVTLDADTLFTPQTVGKLVEQFSSPRVGAVAGVIKVGNWSTNVITRWQALEYVTQIGLERSAAALLDAVMVVPGACAAWRRDAVLQAGGYTDATMAEDCELTLALHRHGWRVEQADEAVAWTEAPETVDALLRQRVRWMYGTIQAVWRHRDMLLRPRYGWLGMLIMPMTVVTITVPLLFTPLIVLGVVQTLSSQGPLALAAYFAAFALVYGVLAAIAVRLLKERAEHLLMVPVYRLIYEPLRVYLLYASLGTALRGVRLGWNKLTRTANMDDVATGTAPSAAVRPVVVGP
ncbi:bifunctional polysaccharide deacetylase/glycosyltransferase family 2 protein [Geodermatophilus sp. DSM 45219]|uniref:bifunctional polysaccharide deacetylase/glycosyltransferase family 2 protein n=1 Tax=Geodermatophilus sp. DSM 45219 TaxID=1881103 RepID=UPI0008830757|nr:bifunctional polysaccharide deacetylase/glycosyltransferase family 2 protein [Geodermatophilus sp. DSM 45219]SDN54945.1 biofilm PGA synthesis N-glycosyltransferase PgaC [Geodermatophilus sp. DSM 45219]